MLIKNMLKITLNKFAYVFTINSANIPDSDVLLTHLAIDAKTNPLVRNLYPDETKKF